MAKIFNLLNTCMNEHFRYMYVKCILQIAKKGRKHT